MLADFHLLRPFWLLALLPAIFLWWLLLRHRQDNSPWQQLIAYHLQPVVLLGQQLQQKSPLAMPVLALSWLIGIIALSGPSWQKLPQPALTVQRATVLIMDMSLSMRATDMVPDRLTQQRFKALDFVDKLREGDLALISYAADAFVISPLTPDHNNIRLQIPSLRPELMPGQGSNVLAALQLAQNLLQQANYPSGDIVLFTDGFEPDTYHAIQQFLNASPYRLSILAFGQAEGAVVRLENGELLKNSQGAVVLPRVPLEQLQILARQGGGVFRQASADNTDLQALIAAGADNQVRRDAEALFAGDRWQDNAVYLVWLLLPLALWLAKRAPILLLLPAMYLPRVEASSWQNLWQTRQQQAAAHYSQQEYDQAQQKFTDPLWRGNAAYRAGEYNQAAEAFQQAAAKQPSVAAWHNLGNALAMQGEYAQGLAAYEQALALDPDNEAANANAELMRQLLEQQEQQQENSNKSQDQQSQSSSQQEQDAEQQSAANNEQSDEQGTDAAGNEQQEAEPNNAAEPESPSHETKEQESEQDSLSGTPELTDDEADHTDQEQASSIIEQSWPNATPEQQQELENLLRKVQDDPGILLRNRMLLEHQKRRHQPPAGVRQEW